jgi:hypothetical protein
MPAQYDLPAVFNQGIEDIEKFNRLPFYLVKNEVELFPQWNIWDQLFGDVSWQQNEGDTMKGVRPEPSPVGRTLFYPRTVISGEPNKDVFEVYESTEIAQVKWHQYESKQFYFVPSWRDFRDNQLNYNHKDIVRQVQNGNNSFIRTVIWDRSPTVFLAGTGLVNSPVGEGNVTQTAVNSKTATWLIGNIPNIKSNLSLRVVQNAATVMSEDLNAPFFEGAKNMPQPNEVLKGKYVLLMTTEDWLQFPWDTSTNALKSINLDLIFQGFRGSLFDMVTSRMDRWPLRFGDDGLFVQPQLTQVGTNKTRPNPNYTDITLSKYGVAFLIGAAGYRTIRVGPPPRDFTGLSADKFYKMRWNGEIRLTDQFLIKRGTIAGGDFDAEVNDDGRFLKLKGTCTHGILPAEVYNVMPILYKRTRVAMT